MDSVKTELFLKNENIIQECSFIDEKNSLPVINIHITAPINK